MNQCTQPLTTATRVAMVAICMVATMSHAADIPLLVLRFDTSRPSSRSLSVGPPGIAQWSTGGDADVARRVSVAQDATPPGHSSTQPPEDAGGSFPGHEPWGGDPAEFFLGAFTGFVGHETGHLIANCALDTNPHLMDVEFSFIPFFTIEPGRELNNRDHAITAAAGFNAQHIINEWLLTEHPDLHHEQEPYLKGLAHFNFWLSIGYAASGFAGYGPDERDTKGIADSIGWSEDALAGALLVPTLLDAYRYKHADAKWAKTASRASKLLFAGLFVLADD